jgi:glycosyltransferase involved in cell wall biosynthesis
MRLVIVSDMPHHRRGDAIVGHGATVRELDALATLFADVRHVAFLYDGPAPASALPYTAANVTLVPLPAAGGVDLAAKLGVLRRMPGYLATIARELAGADAVHVRAPASTSLAAIAALTAGLGPARRWIKYAGSWQGYPGEPASYRLQRAWLARAPHRAQVTINGAFAGQPAFVHSFVNPCLTDDELAHGRAAGLAKQLAPPIRLLFVGHLGAAKGPRVAVDTLAALVGPRGAPDLHLDLVGEGDDRAALEAHARAVGVADRVRFLGALPRPALAPSYAAAHFVILPSRAEGWPKVLSEGMAAGAVPIATAVGSIGPTLAHLATGVAVRRPVAADFAAAIAGYLAEPARWRADADRALAAAPRFGYAAYLRAVRTVLGL